VHHSGFARTGLDGVDLVKIIYEAFRIEDRYTVTAQLGRIRYYTSIPCVQWHGFDAHRRRYWPGRIQYMAQTNLTPP